MSYSEDLRSNNLNTMAISRMVCEIGSRIKNIQDHHHLQLQNIKRLEDDIAVLNTLLKNQGVKNNAAS